MNTPPPSSPRLHIATCRQWPQGNADLQALAAALGAGLTPWQDLAPAACAQATVLPLAAWDYSEQPAAWQAWLQALQAAGARLLNPPELLHWNLDKRYLLELAARCAQAAKPVAQATQAAGPAACPPLITPSLALLPGDDWAPRISASGWPNPVLKPLIGQSGRGVRRLGGQWPNAQEFAHGALLQAYLPAPFGEVCLVYLGGRFSHAAHRQSAPGEWRANSAYGVRIAPITARPEWLARAQTVLAQLPPHLPAPLYARVDGLITGSAQHFTVNEVELIEPALYPSLHPGGIAGFAQALRQALAAASPPPGA